jgi:hypothetical protein
LKADIEGQVEAELIQVEVQAAVQIANKDVDGVDAEVGVLAVEADGSSAAHGGDYRV